MSLVDDAVLDRIRRDILITKQQIAFGNEMGKETIMGKTTWGALLPLLEESLEKFSQKEK